MLSIPSSVKIYLSATAVDMRKGFDGLSALIVQAGHDVYSGHLFVFVSRRRDRAKILTWARGGFVVWYKRLERGRFRRPAESEVAEGHLELDSGQLMMLMDGVDLDHVRRVRAWAPKKRRESQNA